MNSGVSKTTCQTCDARNAYDPEGYLECLDANYVIESDTVPRPIRGLEAAGSFLEMAVEAFPDLHFNIDQMIASGDAVVTRWTATSTASGLVDPRWARPSPMLAAWGLCGTLLRSVCSVSLLLVVVTLTAEATKGLWLSPPARCTAPTSR